MFCQFPVQSMPSITCAPRLRHSMAFVILHIPPGSLQWHTFYIISLQWFNSSKDVLNIPIYTWNRWVTLSNNLFGIWIVFVNILLNIRSNILMIQGKRRYSVIFYLINNDHNCQDLTKHWNFIFISSLNSNREQDPIMD